MRDSQENGHGQPIRVLHVAPSLDRRYGGPTIAFSGLLSALCKIGVDARGVGKEAPSNVSVAEELAGAGVPLHEFSLTRLSRFQSSAFEAVVKEVDVVHMHGIWEPHLFAVYSACIKYKRPYFLRACGMLTDWSLGQKPWRKSLYRLARANRMIRNADAIHFSTQQELNESQSAIRSQRAIIEPNGFDAQVNAFATERMSARLPANETSRETPYILFVGRLDSVKGIDLLLKAFASVQPTQIELVIAGAGTTDYQQELHQLARSLNIESKVRFVGMVSGDAKLELYRHAELFVLPSHHENFGNVVLEAISQATPVIVSNRVALSDAVVQYHVGEVCELNVASLAHHMNQLLASPERIREYKRNTPLMANDFQWEQIAQRWAKHYRHALKNQVGS